jgi:hypothetical protein
MRPWMDMVRHPRSPVSSRLSLLSCMRVRQAEKELKTREEKAKKVYSKMFA